MKRTRTMNIKRFFCLLPVLLFGGCASYYRTMNDLAAFMDALGRVGKEIVFGGDEINPEVARFQKVAVETGGVNVYRTVFCPRGPRLYSCALDYAGTEADYDGVPFDVEVEIGVFRKGRMVEHSKKKVRGPCFYGGKIVYKLGGSVLMAKATWHWSEELTVYLRCGDRRFEEKLSNKGGRLYVYESSSL